MADEAAAPEAMPLAEELGLLRDVTRAAKNLRAVLMARLMSGIEAVDPKLAKALRDHVRVALQEEVNKFLRIITRGNADEEIEYGDEGK